MVKTWLAAIAGILAAHAASAQQTIAYGTAPDMLLDLYQPKPSASPAKLVVFVHGGAWTGGNKAVGANIAPSLTAEGYAVASIDYRKVPEVTPQTQLGDAAAAIAYLQHNAGALHLNPRAIALLGHSSGGHVVALLGTDQRYLARAGVDLAGIKAIIVLDGVYDVAANVTHYPNATRREVFGTDRGIWQSLSPTEQLGQMVTRPGFCLLHETTDPRFIEQANLFEAALRAHGLAPQTAKAAGLRHGQLVNRFDDPSLPMLPFTLQCLARYLR